ncbi:hypothetical protein FOC4_g10006726 [Fusarium odoratissimum]|uniref:Uncharacterized protein n=1 Tax=Fusarium oxysporum f. sp. cubense (strain race 4) TaxID=2502994 RepID=N1RKT0_FUSC4|nr:hypothetical protein FOC4_g10006726 [Fusarium odoratissimum]
MRYHRRRQGKYKSPEERFNPDDRYRRSHRGRRGRHAHSSHRQPQRNERRNSANTGCLRYAKHAETPADIVLEPQPDKTKVVAEDVPRRKSKWKFWAKQPPSDDAEASDAPETSDPNNEPQFTVTSDPRPSLLESHEEAPISTQLHTVMRRLSQGE